MRRACSLFVCDYFQHTIFSTRFESCSKFTKSYFESANPHSKRITSCTILALLFYVAFVMEKTPLRLVAWTHVGTSLNHRKVIESRAQSVDSLKACSKPRACHFCWLAFYVKILISFFHPFLLFLALIVRKLCLILFQMIFT